MNRFLRHPVWICVLSLLMLAAALLPGSAWAKPQSFQLFQIFHDSGETLPLGNTPYQIQLNGKHSEYGVTDAKGFVITHHRKPGARQEFVVDIFNFGIYSFVVDKQDHIKTQPMAVWQFRPDWSEECRADCNGKGFYWIQLIGNNTYFASEPYMLTVAGQTFSGTVNDEGYIFVPWDNPPPLSEAMTLKLCNGTAIEIKAGTAQEAYSFRPLKNSGAPAPADCAASTLKKYAQENAQLNGGAPYIFTAWAKGASPVEIAQQERRKEQDKLDEYRSLAAANNDPLAWLGKLPPTWSEEEYKKRNMAVMEKVMADIEGFSPDEPLRFKCKTPAQVGPIPDMEGVEAFLDGFPDSASDPQLIARLYAAAAKGNWLAIAQIFSLQSQRRPEGNDYFYHYRFLQLMEWLQEHKIGALYRIIDDSMAATGGPAGGFTVYAALHNSYPSQYEVGKKLESDNNPELRKIGEKMQACALNSLPAYRKLLEK